MTTYKSRIDYTIELYEQLTNNTGHFISSFSTGQQLLKRQYTEKIIERLSTYIIMFLDIVYGKKEIKGLELNALCFTSRFLKCNSTMDLHEHNRYKLEKIIEDTFYLGLINHFLYYEFPTRNNYETVNYSDIITECIPFFLVAKIQMKEYEKRSEFKPSKIYEYFYKTKIETILKHDLEIGFLKRSLCRSFLKNIFFCGSLLGVKYDQRTK